MEAAIIGFSFVPVVFDLRWVLELRSPCALRHAKPWDYTSAVPDAPSRRRLSSETSATAPSTQAALLGNLLVLGAVAFESLFIL
ncbi:hypothetical protein ACEN8K_03775, partial [Variovorax sp. CT11-76]